MVKNSTKLKKLPLRPPPDESARERTVLLRDGIKEDPSTLLDLANQSIVTATQFDYQKVIQLCRLAAKYETSPTPVQRPLTGKIMVSAFYEPSTRTRLSFESAWHRLGGDIMSITDPSSTGIAKGESYRDIAEMLNSYGDVVVLRDTDPNAIYEMMKSLRVPIINGGNGKDEHPTQALADIYVLLKHFPQFLKSKESADKVKIGVIGVPSKMRTVRSLLIFLSLFQHAVDEIVIACDGSDVFSEGQRELLEERGLKFRIVRDLSEDLAQLDVVYINAIIWTKEGYEEVGSRFKLNKDSKLKKNALILHPLARGAELALDLDETPHNGYFEQAQGAVYVRMALLTCYVWMF